MVLAEVLTPADLERVRASLGRVPFRDGRATAGPAARDVKLNQQARGDDWEVGQLGSLVRSALQQHPTFHMLVRPVRWSQLMFSRYEQGHRYGLHTDNSTMIDENGWPMRTDMSFTLFLSDPSTYEGGALRLTGPHGESVFRPASGDAVLYPTGVIHEVTPVTSGARLACVGWVQSLIRRADQREILFDLASAHRNLAEEDAPLLMEKAIGNLLRMWGEG